MPQAPAARFRTLPTRELAAGKVLLLKGPHTADMANAEPSACHVVDDAGDSRLREKPG